MSVKTNRRRGPLAGIIVLDLTRALSGPFCGMTLYNLGSTVIKVERPGSGDDARAFPPFVEGKPGYFDAINYGKKSIGLDFKNPSDRTVFEELVQKADVLLENFRPGVMDRFGFGWDDVHEKNPSLIYAAISGFGHNGPYSSHPAYDMVVQCMSGIVSVTGPKNAEEPTRPGTSFSDIYGGLLCVAGINAALLNRQRTGKGCKVDIAMLDGQISVMESYIARYSVDKSDPETLGSSHPSFAPLGVYEAKDGLLAIAAVTDQQFADLCNILDLANLVHDKKFVNITSRLQNMATLDEQLQRKISGWNAAELEHALTAANIACGPLQNIRDLVASDVAAKRRLIKHFDDPVYQNHGVYTVGNPMKSDRYDEPEMWPPPPELDEHRAQILSWLNGGAEL